MLWRFKRLNFALRHIWKMGSLEYAIDFISHRKLKTRKGECSICGKCCGITNPCRYLGTDNRCTLYYDKDIKKKAPWCFKECPFSEKALVPGCTYYWDKKEKTDKL